MRISRVTLKRGQRRGRMMALPTILFFLRTPKVQLALIAGLISFCVSVFFIFEHAAASFLQRTSRNFTEATHRFGYTLQDIVITGRKHTPVQDILKLMDNHRGGPLFKTSVEIIREHLLTDIPWVKKARVQRLLPGQFSIEIEERTPIALWQHQKKFYLVDNEGIVIDDHVAGFENLPVVVGIDAPRHTPGILLLLEQYVEVKKRLTALVSIQMRRFDLILQGNLVIKLPEIHIETALARLNFLLESKKLNLDEVTMIDLRLPKQLIVKVSKQAAERLKLKIQGV